MFHIVRKMAFISLIIIAANNKHKNKLKIQPFFFERTYFDLIE